MEALCPFPEKVRTTNLPTDVTKSDEESRNATAALLSAAREQFERSFWWFPKNRIHE
jgi:hypothetical protein